MNDFKEWLSDYLRYFLLFLAGVLTLALVVIGVKVYKAMTMPVENGNIEILTEIDTEEETESELKAVVETEELRAEMNKEVESDEIETESDLNEIQAETMHESVPDTDSEQIKETQETAAVTELSDRESEVMEQLISVESEKETELITEVITETEYIPVYKTLKGSCYIRSGPSMEAEIIGEYMYGTTVEFLEDVGGWYKVQIDGMTGYMGARFF